MAPEKRNVYLDANDSDEDDIQSYDSEADDLRKGGRSDGGRSSKRRKLDADSDDEDDFAESDSDDDLEAEKLRKKPADIEEKMTEEEKPAKGKRKAADEEEQPVEEDEDDSNKKKRKALSKLDKADLPGVSQPLTKKNLVNSEKARRRSGVVYLSRVPPYMKPSKLRSLLTPYGTINRIFLSPEDPLSHTRRVRAGGNKKRSYVDGWVEFVRKADAKRAVDLLNTQAIGGKKSSYYHDDMWNLVYLRGFKWHNLTHQIATENAERDSRMRAEISQTKLENAEFVRNVELAKMQETMEERAETRAEARAEARQKNGEDNTKDDTAEHHKTVRSIKQKKRVSRAEPAEQPERVQRVLSKIF